MKPIIVIGIVLVILGVLAFAYQGINYNHQGTVIEMGPMRATTETHDRFPLHPILAGLTLAGGVALLVIGARHKS